MIHWILGENLYNDMNLIKIEHALKNNDCKYDIVKIIPFSHELIPNINIDDTSIIICLGSTTLGRISKHRNWYPGVFESENFSYPKMIENYGKYFLNYDCVIDKLENINPTYEVFFIKPVDDSKLFIGETMFIADFNIWKEKLLKLQKNYEKAMVL